MTSIIVKQKYYNYNILNSQQKTAKKTSLKRDFRCAYSPFATYSVVVKHKKPKRRISFSMKNSETVKSDTLDVVKSILVAILFSLGLILIFALIIRWASVDSKAIAPVNYAIKILSILLGVLIGFKNKQNGILKGAVVGLVYTLLSFFIFACLDGFKSADYNWFDLIFLPIAGGISGVIAVNVKSRRRA